MGWPTPDDYDDASQNLRHSMGDEELRAGQATLDDQQLPMVWAGNFAHVYKIHCPHTGNTWALKCFTKDIRGRVDRYARIAECLKLVRLPFAVPFEYLEQGVKVRGEWFPALKMQWVEGQPLNSFVEASLGKRAMLEQLLDWWPRLAARVREAGIAHADLQHGNVLLVPMANGQLAIRLIDYDGMYVPSLAGTQSGELGHAAYQHPQRIREGTYSADLDRFSHLVIYTAVHCLKSRGRDLWRQFNNDDNLLFRQADFRQPGASTVFQSLWNLGDEQARAMVGRLMLACRQRLEEAPWLDQIVEGGRVKALTHREQQAIASLMAAGRAATRSNAPRSAAATAAAIESPVQPLTPTVLRDAEPIRDLFEEVELVEETLPETLRPEHYLHTVISRAIRNGRRKVPETPLPEHYLPTGTLWPVMPAPQRPEPAPPEQYSITVEELLRRCVTAVARGLDRLFTVGKSLPRRLTAAARGLDRLLRHLVGEENDILRYFLWGGLTLLLLLSCFLWAPLPLLLRLLLLLFVAVSAGVLTVWAGIGASTPWAGMGALTPSMPTQSEPGQYGITVDLGGGVMLEMVLIPAGSFMMGDDRDEPVHKVNITKPFYLGKYEVTQEQWEAVMGNNPSRFKGPKNPVEQVSWNDCQEFMAEIDGKFGVGWGKFQFPTEAQWEYACRAGSATRYCYGDDSSELDAYAWYSANSHRKTHPVGEKKPNAWGLYDMHGNVWEWCSDWYGAGYYAKSPVRDPPGPDFAFSRVLRGGSWGYDYPGYFRCAARSSSHPDSRYITLGFRVARTLAP